MSSRPDRPQTTAPPTTSAEGLILPHPDEDSAPFWEGALRGELRMQACASCSRRRFPPRPMCPHCRSLEVRWEPVSGRGTIWSFVVAHPPLLPAYQALAPYNCVVVALDEDPALRMVGNLVTSEGGPINEIESSTIEIGQAVRVIFQRMSDEIALPRWLRD